MMKSIREATRLIVAASLPLVRDNQNSSFEEIRSSREGKLPQEER